MNTDISVYKLRGEDEQRLIALFALYTQYLAEVGFDLNKSFTQEVDRPIEGFLLEQEDLLYVWFGRKK